MKQILLSIRMLLRFKVYTFINFTGLVFSISCALIIARYIHQENNVDHFCPELERTFLMTTVMDNGQTYLSGSIDPNKDPTTEILCQIHVLKRSVSLCCFRMIM